MNKEPFFFLFISTKQIIQQKKKRTNERNKKVNLFYLSNSKTKKVLVEKMK